MSADSDKMRRALDDQLSNLDNHLGGSSDDIKMLTKIQQGIGQLLADQGGSEAEIRRVLQDRYESGALRKETYQLVKSMLDNYVSENVPTSPRTHVDTGEPTAMTTSAIDVEAVAEQESRQRVSELGLVEEPEADEFSSTAVIPNEELRPPTADETVQVGSVLRDRFLLQERVSGGSMGVVYRAMDRRLAEAASTDPWVAIKVLSPQLSRNGPALRALQQEAAKGRCLAHPGIVRFVDFDRDDDLYFIVMEWLDGRTLANILDSPDSKTITAERAVDIVRQVAKALDYAHKCGIVHADVKPGNVMVLPTGDTKIFDFGIARVMQTQSDDSPFDQALLSAITPEYSSMQVLTGEEPVPSDDVFSLACLLYRLVAGYRVFGPRNAAEAAEEGMKPQRLRELPKYQWNAVRKALSFSRVARFSSMTDFLDALDNQADVPITFEEEDRFIDEESHSNKSWLLGLIALIAVLGFAGYQFGVLDKVQAMLDPAVTEAVTAAPAVGNAADEQAQALRQADQPFTDATEVVTPETQSTQESPAVDEVAQNIPAVPIVDFSTLPPPDFEITFSSNGVATTPVAVTIREDSEPVVVDLVRSSGLHLSLDVRIEEVGHSGNRSPWSSRQFEISDGGSVSFPNQQDRARISITMASDPLREPDQQSTLLIREADSASTELAKIELTLEDDDQRTFESRLPRNTIAFAVSQIAVAERDPAVQIDVLRFNPSQQPVVVGYALKDITATEGQDYFDPGGYSIRFEPGQRTARVLIPLVQDSVVEGDEAFTVELATDNAGLGGDVYTRLVVMIRDDDDPQ